MQFTPFTIFPNQRLVVNGYSSVGGVIIAYFSTEVKARTQILAFLNSPGNLPGDVPFVIRSVPMTAQNTF